jgi:hypothetical protein
MNHLLRYLDNVPDIPCSGLLSCSTRRRLLGSCVFLRVHSY